MHAMQYPIALPADYDMGVIRRRVASRGGLTDGFAGLGLKAYLVRERGIGGSPVNQYAPFYLWRSAEGMNAFLYEGPFGGIERDFGRPRIDHWVGAAFTRGSASGVSPRAATRRITTLPPDVTAADALSRAREDLSAEAGRPGVVAAALAVDPSRWQILRFLLWEQDLPELPPADTTDPARRTGPYATVGYRVLHLSSPEIDQL